MKLRLLQGYFNTMLFRDLAERHEIKNIEALRYFLKRVMQNLTKTTSINAIANDMRSNGVSVSKDDLYNWADWAVLMPQSEDKGKLLENIVALELFRRRGADRKMFYWQEGRECDFVVQHEDYVEELIQVTWDMADEDTRKREIEGIKEAAKGTKCDKLTIVTRERKETIEEDGFQIEVVGIEEWLSRR